MKEAIRDLDPIEQRILGALLEKSQTTPDYYPMTLNALIAACNQKSNREPVSTYTEANIADGLERLRADVLVWRSESSRSVRWSESITRRIGLDDPKRALMTLLLLRGPQTPGELRSRSGRLHSFDSLAEIDDHLREMARGNDPMVREIERAPGQKERRWAQLLGGPIDETKLSVATPASVPAAQERSSPTAQRLEELEGVVAKLTERIELLEALFEPNAEDRQTNS